jgi:hypothetical protein
MRRFDRAFSSLLTLCALTGALLAPTVVRAGGVSPIDASAEQKKQATAHFIVGKRALESHDWDKAVVELSASLDQVDSPNARLELARALRDSGKLAEAWIEFGRAAETATKLAQSEERYAKTAEAASAERQDIAAKLAFVEVTVTHAPADARLKVGDQAVVSDDWSAPFPAAPGAVDVVVASAAGAELARRTVNVTAGQTTPVSLDAQPVVAGAAPPKDTKDIAEEDKPPSDAPPQPVAPPSDTSAGSRRGLRTAAYVSGAVGVAGLATFAVFGLLSNSTYNDLKNACPHGCPPDKQSEVDSGITQQMIANVGIAVGLFGLAAGTTLFLLSPPPKSQVPAAAIIVGPGYLGVRGSL